MVLLWLAPSSTDQVAMGMILHQYEIKKKNFLAALFSIRSILQKLGTRKKVLGK